MARKARKRAGSQRVVWGIIAMTFIASAYAFTMGNSPSRYTQVAVGTAADAMCMGGADAKCKCGKGLKNGKCDDQKPGGGKIGCPCFDMTAGDVAASGKCEAVGKCKADKADGMPPMLPMLPMPMMMMPMMMMPSCPPKTSTTTDKTATSTASTTPDGTGSFTDPNGGRYDPNCPPDGSEGGGFGGGFGSSWFPDYGSGNTDSGSDSGSDDTGGSGSGSESTSGSVWGRIMETLGIGSSGGTGSGEEGGVEGFISGLSGKETSQVTSKIGLKSGSIANSGGGNGTGGNSDPRSEIFRSSQTFATDDISQRGSPYGGYSFSDSGGDDSEYYEEDAETAGLLAMLRALLLKLLALIMSVFGS